jgi:hypothetical protein
MKLFLRSCLCCASLCAFFSSVSAQDFLITLNNDTLKGEIKKQFIGFYRFKPDGTDNFNKIKIRETKEFYKAEKEINYLVKQRPDKRSPDFLQRLVRGKIDLFEYYRQTGNNQVDIVWYASKQNGELLEVKSNHIFGARSERKDKLYSLIGDKPELLEKFKKDDSYSFDAVKECIKSYNAR